MKSTRDACGLSLASLTVLGAQDEISRTKLSGPMVSGVVGDAADPRISPDGTRVIYRVPRRSEVAGSGGPTAQLFVAPMDGSAAPIALTPADLDVEWATWTPDGTRAVMVVENGDELQSVEADGSAAPVVLQAGVFIWDAPSYDDTIQVTADGSRVAYLRELGAKVELYSVPVDGSAVPVPLNGILAAARDVDAFLLRGSTVVYLSDEEVDQRKDLHSVPVDGSAAPIKITNAAPATSVLSGFDVDPTGTRAVYRQGAGPQPLFSALVDGSSAPVQLSAGAASVESFRVAPDGSRVVYRHTVATNQYRLFVALIDGSAAPTLLTPLGSGGTVFTGYAFSPDASRVVYEANTGLPLPESKLFSVRLSDGAVVALWGALVDSFETSSDSNRVVFEISGASALRSAPIDGSGPAEVIHPTLVDGGTVSEYQIAPDSQLVVYLASAETPGVFELYRAPLDPDGLPSATKLSPTLVAGGQAGSVVVAPDSVRVAFLCDAVADDVTQLYRAELSGAPDPLDLSGPLLVGEVGDVMGFVIANGVCVYAADEDTDEVFELYGVPMDGSAPAVKVSGTLVSGGDVSHGFPSTRFHLTPDGTRVVYVANAEVATRTELWSAPSDGSAAPIKLNGELSSGTQIDSADFRMTPDGTRIVYLADQTDSPGVRLHAVPITGGPSTPLASSSNRFEVTPASTHVLFVDTRLYAQPIDGSASPVDLSGAVSTVSDFAATSDGTRAVFRVISAGAWRLYGRALAGGPLLDLSGALVTGGNVTMDFVLSPGGARALFRADAFVDERFLLFSVPTDGSSAPIAINGPLDPDGDVVDFLVSPDDVHAVYVATDELAAERLHSVLIDGSAPSTQLSAQTSVYSFQFTPDGNRVIARIAGWLRSLSLDGNVNVPLASFPAQDEVTVNNRTVFYSTTPGGLFSVGTHGGAPLTWNPESSELSVATFQAAGRRVLFVGTSYLALKELYSYAPSRSAQVPVPTATRTREVS